MPRASGRRDAAGTDCSGAHDLTYTHQAPTKRLKTTTATAREFPPTTSDHACKPGQSSPPARARHRCRTARQARSVAGDIADPGAEIDIEDLYDLRCTLVSAPVVPSQSENEYPLSAAFGGTWEVSAGGIHFYPAHRKNSSRSSQETHSRTQRQTRPRPRPQAQLPLSCSSRPQPGHDPPDGSQECLLERVNPDYFGRDKYRWHSSMVSHPCAPLPPCLLAVRSGSRESCRADTLQGTGTGHVGNDVD